MRKWFSNVVFPVVTCVDLIFEKYPLKNYGIEFNDGECSKKRGLENLERLSRLIFEFLHERFY